MLAEWFEYDDPEKWRKGIVQATKFIKDAEKTLEELSAKLEEKVERKEKI